LLRRAGIAPRNDRVQFRNLGLQALRRGIDERKDIGKTLSKRQPLFLAHNRDFWTVPNKKIPPGFLKVIITFYI
jgi:hypothetical protein